MCRIYTSYFANIKNIQKIIPDCEFVAISNPPKNMDCVVCNKLIPKYNAKDNIKFKELYTKQLNSLVPDMIVRQIQHLTDNADNIVLLCYEKSNEYCHRKLISDWLNESNVLYSNVEEICLY